METTKAFYDFCIPLNGNSQKLKSIINECIEFGYKTIAIEQKYDHTKRDATKKISDIFPQPVDLRAYSEFHDRIKILQRLTIQYSDVNISHFMTNSTNIKKYHLIAGIPKTEAALNHCCTIFNGDIVTFNASDEKLYVNRKSYQVAVKRGMYFEIKYSPLIKYSNLRKDIIKIAHNYHAKGKSKNIIISSEATDPFDLRGPYDVANLSLILGLSEEQGKSAISSNCQRLYLRAESRRLGKTVMILKQYGPIVFSSTEEESTESEMDTDSDKEDPNKVETKDVYSQIVELPTKRKKIN